MATMPPPPASAAAVGDVADSTTPTRRLDRWRLRRPFVEGEDVLLHGQDGLMYFGIVVEVDDDVAQCLVSVHLLVITLHSYFPV